MEELMLLIFLYILPAILFAIVVYRAEEEVTVKNLLKIILMSMTPVVNIISGFLMVIHSERVNKFLNKRIK